VTILTCRLPEAGAYGRVIFEGERPVRVVEAKDDERAARQAPADINSGMMVFDVAWLRTAISRLTPSASTGELYMTDLVEHAAADGPGADGAWPVAVVRADPDVARGINDRYELAEADAILRQRIRRELMRSGVTLVGPESIFVDADVEIGPDTTLLPFTTIGAGTRIGSGCTIGPQAHLVAATIGDRVAVKAATVVRSTVLDGADVGPYAHVRGGSIVGPAAHVGTSAELKAARLGPGAKVGHFSYVGDATLGAGVNIGAGTITANFDGRDKHATEIGDGAFIGSDTVLVAPVRVGAGARTGAGSVVTRDVADGVTVVGIPARPIRRDGKAAGGRDGKTEEESVPAVPPPRRPAAPPEEDS
jgi:bifunctional UDP-N-acetylglucosamine pyrophosphorylase/glucosamine-1-phosphate N-acetyltransferase